MKTHLFKYIENFTTKKQKFQTKFPRSFLISAKYIDCGYLLELPQQGEYPQPMFLSRNKKINVYPCKPQVYCIKVGFKRFKTGSTHWSSFLFALPHMNTFLLPFSWKTSAKK